MSKASTTFKSAARKAVAVRRLSLVETNSIQSSSTRNIVDVESRFFEEASKLCIDKDDVDHPGENESLLTAVALLKKLQKSCVQNADSKTATITIHEVEELLGGFVHAMDPEKSKWMSEAGRGFRKRLSQEEIGLDETVHNFIAQNYMNTSEADHFRQAVKRTSLLKRCIATFAYKSPKALSATQLRENLYDIVGISSLPSKENEVVSAQLSKISTWEFDVLQVSEILQDHTLLLVTSVCTETQNLLQYNGIPVMKFRNFINNIEKKYNKLPYHNAFHAADVVQATHFFFTLGGLGSVIHERYRFLALVAAAVHDVGHMGFNNNYYIATNDPLAIRYCYRSCLENMHCAISFELMRDVNSDIFELYNDAERLEARSLLVDMILATDTGLHAAYLGKFNTIMESKKLGDNDSFSVNGVEDQRLILQIAIHAADVSNPARMFSVYERWRKRVMEEFYAQGDKEIALGLKASIGYDRSDPIPVEKMQAGFIVGIVNPVFEALMKVDKVSLKTCMDQLQLNLEHFKSVISKNREELGTAPPALESKPVAQVSNKVSLLRDELSRRISIPPPPPAVDLRPSSDSK